jgi:hypothetical protein
MSFIDLAGQLSGAQGAGASSSGLLGSVVRQGLSEGLSANTMLTGLQSQGIGIRRGNFLALVSDVRASNAAGLAAQGASLTSNIPLEAVGQVSTGRQGIYRSNVTMRFRGPAVSGERMVESTTFTVTHESLLRPVDIINAARDIWSVHSDLYDSQLLDSEYTGTIYNPGQL